jgi:hypothetical protein
MALKARVRGVPFGRALTDMLKPLELHWAPKTSIDEGIVITASLSDADRNTVRMIMSLLPE